MAKDQALGGDRPGGVNGEVAAGGVPAGEGRGDVRVDGAAEGAVGVAFGPGDALQRFQWGFLGVAVHPFQHHVQRRAAWGGLRDRGDGSGDLRLVGAVT